MRKLLLLALVLLAACTQTADPTPPAGGQLDITSFTATPNPFRIGDTVTFEWTIEGEIPTKLELMRIDVPIETIEVAGTRWDTIPSEGATYALVAESPNGFDLENLELVMTE